MSETDSTPFLQCTADLEIKYRDNIWISVNIVYPPENIVIAKTCGCKENNNKVTYALSAQFHALCMDKKDIIRAEIEACERLLKYAPSESDRAIVEKEIAELRTALDLIS